MIAYIADASEAVKGSFFTTKSVIIITSATVVLAAVIGGVAFWLGKKKFASCEPLRSFQQMIYFC